MDLRLAIDVIRTFTVILGGLLAGYCLRKSGRLSEETGSAINRWAMAYLQPIVIILALWVMDRPGWREIALPVYAALLIVLMWPVSLGMARALGLPRGGKGAFIGSGMFSNVGYTYGTFIAFVALGPQGAALGSLYCLSFSPLFYTLGFYLGRRYAPGAKHSALAALLGLLRERHTLYPILSIFVGLGLSLSGVPAPAETAFVLDLGLPLVTGVFLIAIGLGLRLSAVRLFWRECLQMHLAKFVLCPTLGLGLAYLFGYFSPGNHALLKLAIIQSTAPTAIMSVLLADLFDLDRRLAGALWLTTNITAIVLAPLVLVIVRLL